MTTHMKCEELLRQAEKLLLQADNELGACKWDGRQKLRKRRNALNSACNALHRATQA